MVYKSGLKKKGPSENAWTFHLNLITLTDFPSVEYPNIAKMFVKETVLKGLSSLKPMAKLRS